MTDIFPPHKRSQIMSSVRSYDTLPERQVRSLLHRMGYRFRTRQKQLPGNPDIVLSKHKKVVFVHGCFWHGHKNCKRAKRPDTNIDFWALKLDNNIKEIFGNGKNWEGLAGSRLLSGNARSLILKSCKRELSVFLKWTNVPEERLNMLKQNSESIRKEISKLIENFESELRGRTPETRSCRWSPYSAS